MGSGDWGNGYPDRERSRGAATPRPGEQAPPPDLWATDPADTWPPSPPQVPQQRNSDPYGQQQRPPATESPVVEPDAYYLPPRAAPTWGRTGTPPVSPAPYRRPSLASAVAGSNQIVPRPVSHSAPLPVPRPTPHRAEEPEEEEYEDDPGYGRVLGFTVAWFALPSVLYLLWMLTLTGDRRSIALHTFSNGLGWIVGAGILSLIVAAILRWAVTGWRALTISFAGAVIGAGVATIAHSLAFAPG